jgi:hypothetical protein
MPFIEKSPKKTSTTITREAGQQILFGLASMKAALSGADIHNACFRGCDGIEWVDFLYGSRGGDPPCFAGGWGIAKEIAKRSYEHGVDEKDPSAARTLAAIPLVIVLGKATHLDTSLNEETSRVRLVLQIKDETYVAFLVKDGKSGNYWLLSGYELRRARTRQPPDGAAEIHDSSRPTSTKPTQSRPGGGAGATEG